MKKQLLFKTILFAGASMIIGNTEAQVKSASFNFILTVLLSSKTPAINIQEASTPGNHYLFLDAREYKEYQVSHIANARFVGDKSFNLKLVEDLPKDKPVIVYCSIGKRSENVTLKMKKAGFTNVKNLYGGIFEWVNQSHPVYNKINKVTDSVDAYSKFWGKWLNRGIKVYD